MEDFTIYQRLAKIEASILSFEERLKDLESSLDDFKKSVYNIKREEESLLTTKENENEI